MIQWYPGHMAKAIREIGEKVKIVDLVVVLLDARSPESSFNPLLKETLKNKRCLYVLTKKDKADSKQTQNWLSYYENKGIKAISVDARDLKNAKVVIKAAEALMEEKRKKDAAKGLKPRPIKTMIVGIPNVGKSTLINALVGKRVAVVGDKPGVTKTQQWIKINQNLELLDTPGVLWPKFEDVEVGYNLALTGAIKDDIIHKDDLILYFLTFLKQHYKQALSYYNVNEEMDNVEILDVIGKNKNYIRNKEVEYERVYELILNDLRNLKLGRITLDR